MIEIKKCKQCGSYPNINVERDGGIYYFVLVCPECRNVPYVSKHSEKSEYRHTLNEIINAWNKEQEA